MKRMREASRVKKSQVTRAGRTHEISVPLPEPPQDLDQYLLHAVLGVAGVMAVAAVGFSTHAIGGLLGGSIAAYCGALVFDVGWLTAQALEWLARYEPTRRKRARRAGIVLLLFSMGVIIYNGYRIDSIGVGLAGAGIAFGAKLVWSAVIGHLVRELDPDTQRWVEAEHQEAHAMLATATVHGRAERTRTQAAAHRLALEARYGIKGTDDVVIDVIPEPEPEQSAPTVRHRRDAIARRAVVDQVRAQTIAGTYGYGPEWHDATQAADASMQAAMDAGLSAEEILSRVDRARPPQPADTPPDPGKGAEAPPEEPQKGTTTARSVVHALTREGVGEEAVRQTLAALQLNVASESIGRYIREARNAQRTEQNMPQPGTGGYW